MNKQHSSFKKCRSFIASDIYRIYGHFNFFLFLKELVWGIGTRFTIWMRLGGYAKQKGFLFSPLYVIAKLFHRHYMFKFGIDVPVTTQIGSGLYIGHFGTIVVSSLATIGKNCNLSHGVTIGAVFRGPRSGAPVVGDNVYFGPGSKVIGKVVIGNNVAIGANCVVTRDVPDNAVVVGIPGKVISDKGSEGYILHTDYI
jgi:serine O-acetyltransferase